MRVSRDVSFTLGIPFVEVWGEFPSRDVALLFEGLPELLRHAQFHDAAMLLLKSKQLGDKESQLEDFYVGLARVGIAQAPYSGDVMRGIELSQSLGLFFQPHFDALDSDALMRYWRRSGYLSRGGGFSGGSRS